MTETQMKLIQLSPKLHQILIERLETLENLVGDSQRKRYVEALKNTIRDKTITGNGIIFVSISAIIHAVLIEHLQALEDLIADSKEKTMIDALKNTILRNSIDGTLETEQ